MSAHEHSVVAESPADDGRAADIAADIRNILEAALLGAGKALTLHELAQLFDELERPALAVIRAALQQLQADYEGRALEVKETASGFRLQVRHRYAGVIGRLWPERPQRYSRALLETLALIAYRQPLTRAEIEAVRGVAVHPHIVKTLLERGWIRVLGHRDLPGRPELLSTTREFLDYFGLRGLDELPPLAQLRNLGEPDPQLDQPAVADGPPAPAPDDNLTAEAEADGDAAGGAPGGAPGEADSDPGTVLVAGALCPDD